MGYNYIGVLIEDTKDKPEQEQTNTWMVVLIITCAGVLLFCLGGAIYMWCYPNAKPASSKSSDDGSERRRVAHFHV
jgi:uncharacterized membrane protein YczE